MSEELAVLLQGDCLEVLKALPDNSIDSLITDPPAGISFMGKAWDDDKGGRKQWIAWMYEVMIQCLRVLKPGAHGLVWALPRTSHWTATALEDAGFEIRDVVTHLFGTGFPKSLNVGKAIKEFEGWGTALKPASEHWILVRKPCSEKTVAANVLMHGVGGLNIDGSRIGMDRTQRMQREAFGFKGDVSTGSASGRFHANLVLSHNPDCVDECSEGCAVSMLDAQSGILVSKWGKQTSIQVQSEFFNKNKEAQIKDTNNFIGDSGGASRFFYCAKASKVDKGRDNTHPTVKSSKLMSYLIKLITPPNGVVLDPFMGSGSTGVAALKEGFAFIGIEKEDEYMTIATKRIG